ncbi:hypothetical protein HHK36_009603 [Tetracentron sinense]|uniref:RING-type E3 ubiquitin transferase n=1 Tax=Tetracentron sinense TaxID=13715 RepID=A0A834ZFJ0_TETSI|nr:hypothetical protein HHK36_009603 [Tetracentron sinense]
MDTQSEKVYVAVGNDSQDGFGILEWALRNWSSHSIISIVIVHFDNTSKDFVHTPFGKLPVSSVSDETLEVGRMCEQEKIDKQLSKYMALCGKAKVELLKIERSEEPIQKVIVDMVVRLRVTKLVMGITLMKSSSRKAKSAISGSFYVHKHKPDFCELFIICGGKLVSLKEENDEGSAEDDQGTTFTKPREKGSLKGWLRSKMFTDNPTNHLSPGRDYPPRVTPSLTNTDSPESRNRWENCVKEIEIYSQWLSSTNLSEEDCVEEEESAYRPEAAMSENIDPNMVHSDKMEAMRVKIEEAQKMIGERRKEAKANVERHTKAEWAILLCNRRAEEVEARINDDIANQIDLKKGLEAAKEQIYEISSDIEKSKSRLSSVLELQSELSNKLQFSSSAKLRAEAQLENAVTARAETLKEIEELRQQRDILRRRIEFCRERDAIVAATTSNNFKYSYREFTADEIRLATNDFSEQVRLKSGGDQTNVYRGRINQTTVAIKLQNSMNRQSQEDFQTKMELLTHIRHPHLIAMIGACLEQSCTVFEYMHNGSLQDILFSSQRNSRKINQTLHWHTRIRIATEVCSVLGFLHSADPRPIVHGDLNPSNILLDRNLVAKISGFKLVRCYDGSEVQSDVCAFGVLLLQLLTGRSGIGLVEEVTMVMEGGALMGILDEVAGEWPLDLAEEFAGIAMRCFYDSGRRKTELRMKIAMRELEELRKKAAVVGVREGCEMVVEGGMCRKEDCSNVPSVFLCPIFQEVMKNPHLAADGFSYEQEAIEEWLGTGHETSPMTNLRLNHKRLTPNHTLRSLIDDWLNNKSSPPS